MPILHLCQRIVKSIDQSVETANSIQAADNFGRIVEMILFDLDFYAVGGGKYALHRGESSVAFVCDVAVFIFADDFYG